MDLGDLAGEGSVSDVDNGTDLHGLWERPVGTGDAGVVTFDGVVGDNLQSLALLELDGLVVDEETGTDLGSLSVEHDCTRLVWALCQGLSEIGDRAAMRLNRKQRCV